MRKPSSPNLNGVQDPSLREALNLIARNIDLLQGNIDELASQIGSIAKQVTATTATTSTQTSTTTTTTDAIPETLTANTSVSAKGQGVLLSATVFNYQAGVAGLFTSGNGRLPQGATWSGGAIAKGSGGSQGNFGLIGHAMGGGQQSVGVLGITQGGGDQDFGLLGYAPYGGYALAAVGRIVLNGPISVSDRTRVDNLNAQYLNGKDLDTLAMNKPTRLTVTTADGNSTVVTAQRETML